ncbi:MAG: hypothetical protein H7061_00655 [Bdellovibrionaceae bacterium]|nr:hypothetical protein [Bdellovibrio sp.]
MTFDASVETEFWMFDDCSEIKTVEQNRYANIYSITSELSGHCEVISIPVPIDCTDRFQVALYARSHEFLNSEVQNSQSAWKVFATWRGDTVREDLESGRCNQKYSQRKRKPFINCQLRLVVLLP